MKRSHRRRNDRNGRPEKGRPLETILVHTSVWTSIITQKSCTPGLSLGATPNLAISSSTTPTKPLVLVESISACSWILNARNPTRYWVESTVQWKSGEHYKIHSSVGSGTTGTVKLIQRSRDRALYAVKITTSEAFDLGVNERKALLDLEHDHIVGLVDWAIHEAPEGQIECHGAFERNLYFRSTLNNTSVSSILGR